MKKIILILLLVLPVFCSCKTLDFGKYIDGKTDLSSTPVNNTTSQPSNKFEMISNDINEREKQMEQASWNMLQSTLYTGIAACLIPVLITDRNQDTLNGIYIGETAVILTGTLITGSFFLNYLDDVNTLGALRAKKYDLYFNPIFMLDPLANCNARIFGLALNLKL